MSINTIGGNPTTPDQARTGRQDTQETDSNSNAAGRGVGNQDNTNLGESVQISSSAIDLQALEARIGELPEVDRGRVTELRNQIANGEYQIDGQQLAARMIDFESQL